MAYQGMSDSDMGWARKGFAMSGQRQRDPNFFYPGEEIGPDEMRITALGTGRGAAG